MTGVFGVVVNVKLINDPAVDQYDLSSMRVKRDLVAELAHEISS
ncbi:hypothetical protein [Sphaerisporangium sp. NPDC051011]